MGRLDGKVAIVVGSATGIGAATAKLMAREGAKVVVADINIDGAEATAAGIRNGGGDAFACPVDNADESAIKTMVSRALERYGRVDVLHNNAAALVPDAIGRDSVDGILNLDIAVFDKTIAVNVRGFALCTKYVLRDMLKRGSGVIVNTSSGASLAAEPTRPCYSTSKAAVNGLTRFVATAYGKQGIRCNAVAPGTIINPDKKDSAWQSRKQREEADHRHNVVPWHGRPEDIAQAVVFLASDDASFINGQVLSVDGGRLIHVPDYGEMIAAMQ